jgi:hypothetical protein
MLYGKKLEGSYSPTFGGGVSEGGGGFYKNIAPCAF